MVVTGFFVVCLFYIQNADRLLLSETETLFISNFTFNVALSQKK